jgi:predicted nucleic acid-binding protein
MLCDTTFLIHYSGQRGRPGQLTARQFAAAHHDVAMYASRISWAEFAEGCETEAEVLSLLDPFALLEINEHVAWIASRLSRDLDRRGLPIGDNDIWIAATALAYRLPLVSRNAKHFARVPGLMIEEY